jgi:hypothetical protein
MYWFMASISNEEKAKRGVLARLAYEAIKVRHSRKVKDYLGKQTLIGGLTVTHMEIFGSSGIIRPGIATSELLARKNLDDGQSTLVENPFFSTRETVEAVLPLMEKDNLIQAKSRKVGAADGTRDVTQYSLTEEGVKYLRTYDPELADKVATRLHFELGDVKADEGEKDTPWAALMPMAKNYADSICRKAEWEKK